MTNPPDSTPILDVTDVHHVYRDDGVDSPVLHGINLRVKTGEFLVIAGPSGCGKTTLLNIIGMMMRPTRGEVRLAGREITALSRGAQTRMRREQVGFVFQRFNLLPTLSARANIELALQLRGDEVDGQAMTLLDRIGLAGKARRKPRALSIGEQQRIAIARAVVGRPSLLLADEPTGNLDSDNAANVLSLLRELHAGYGLTTVMITHNEQLAAEADRVVRMRDGRIVSDE